MRDNVIHLLLYFMVVGILCVSGCGNKYRANCSSEHDFFRACITSDTLTVDNMLNLHPGYINIYENKDTPLHRAASHGNIGVIKVLIKHGAKVNALDSAHFTPLFFAVIGNKVKTAHVLISLHANVNIPDDSGLTPLHMAVMRRNIEMVKLLVESNADVNISDGAMTPLELARSDGSKDIIAYLEEHGGRMKK